MKLSVRKIHVFNEDMRMTASVNMEFLKKLRKDIVESINLVSSIVNKPYSELSDIEKYAIRYHIIVIAEAIIALTLHIVRRKYGLQPETPIHALKILRDKRVVTEQEYIDLANMFKLRNLLVHRYWIIDDEKIYYNVKKNFKNIITFIEKVISNIER